MSPSKPQDVTINAGETVNAEATVIGKELVRLYHYDEWAMNKLIEAAEKLDSARLEKDLAEGLHVAKNRTYELYLAVKTRAEPIQVPHLVLDTDETPVEECVRLCSAFVGAI